VLVLVGGGLAEAVEAGLVPLVVAVREVEAGNGQPGVDQGLEHGNVPARRAQGANDLGLAGRRVGLAKDRLEVDVPAAKAGTGGTELGLRKAHC
jgi:hypothetical protein